MSPLSPLSIAGAGPVAQALGRRLVLSGHTVAAVASRTPERAASAAAFIGGDAIACGYEDLAALGLPTIVAVTDAAIPGVAARMATAARAGGNVVVHTCGASGAEPLASLARAGWRCGMCHPLQTFPSAAQGVDAIAGATFGIAGHEDACAWAEGLVGAMGGVPVRLREGALPLYHAAAVLAGNGAFALIEAALLLLEGAGIPRTHGRPALAPLVQRSVANALAPDADLRLTGPVARGDSGTVARHAEALAHAPAEAARAYEALGDLLLTISARRGLSPDTVQAVRDALHAERTLDGNH